MQSLSLYHTPEDIDEIFDWINRHERRQRPILLEAVMMTINLVIKQSKTTGKPTPSIQWLRLETVLGFKIPSDWDEIMRWIDGQHVEWRAALGSASGMANNFAIKMIEADQMQKLVEDLNKKTDQRTKKYGDRSNEEHTTGEVGFIYILSRASGNIVKIGETSRDPKIREREYVKEYKLIGFTLYKEFPVPLNARKDIERIIHKKLKSKRLSWDNTTGAKEIFECDLTTAVDAVEQAISESELARVELEKQRLANLRRQRLKKAQSQFDAEFEAFKSEWLRVWMTTAWFKDATKEYDNFVATNSFEKEGKRSIGGYLTLIVGWYFLIVGILFGIGTIKEILELNSDGTIGNSMLLAVFAAGLIWLGRLLILLPVSPVPDETAISKKNKLKNKIEKKRSEQIQLATREFHQRYTIKDFFE